MYKSETERICNIVSFVVGTTLTWSSPVISKLQDLETTPFEIPATSDEMSWISSLLPLGAVFGPFIFGYLADRIGRKYTLLICGVPFLVCYFLLAFGKVLGIYYAARFISGLAVGGVFTVIPMYIGEIADNSNRGALGSTMNCFLCLGLLFSYALGPYVSIVAFNIVPHYYVSNEKHDLAKSALQKIRGNETDSIEKELADIQAKLKEEGHGTFFDIFKSKGLIKAFIISVCLVAFQQLSGINAVLFYAQNIFQQAGTSLKPAVCSIIIGGVQFGTSFITPLVCERLGRKILLLMSATGMLIAEVPLAKYFDAISKSIGMGPSFWIFAAFCVAAIPFCLFYVLETKGRSLQEIQNALNA
ncbi:hypothetical protein NQ314_015133 [Rhamnusium bicolor]|uniref:Major facilitator superfamily (MFS) profile domain-containing protein n=1 Tax=Rhamnusium bicolor TaxID=1586634 RepID=A0AAV8X009_9CUCU|nr:hypothetical protein NQ314_015133 [Rhamnusium bicolor]